jgi:hypothetical protein
MELAKQKQITLDSLLVNIEEGTVLADRIDTEYRSMRQDGSFKPETDIARWQSWYMEWYEKCQQSLRDNFHPSVILANRFKNAPVSALGIVGENIEWNSLAKHLSARLEILGDLYESVASIKDDELSDFVEINVGIPGIVGAKIKVDKLLSRIIRR